MRTPFHPRPFFLCCFFLLALSANAEDESKGPFIKGVVVNATDRTPVVYANIVLREASTREFVTSTYSGQTGEFILVGVPKGKYILTISHVGYTKRDVVDLAVEEDTEQLDIGVLGMHEEAVAVDEVTVSAERAPEEFHLDKKVINVGQSLHASGGSVLDVLRDQPSVRVDESDNVTLRGSGNFTVLVNGRPSAFQGSDALRQIPANLVESIELMTNPSAKYEAEGSAGIINIVMKQEKNSSSSGIVNIGAGTRDKYNSDATVHVGLGATKLTAGADYRDVTYYQVQDVDRRTIVPDGAILNETEFRHRNRRDQYGFRLGLDHAFDDRHAMSLNVNGGHLGTPRSMVFDVHNVSPTQDVYQRIENNFDLAADYYTVTGFYNHGIVPKTRELSAEAVYTRVRLPYEQHAREFLTNASFGNPAPEPGMSNQDSDAGRHEARLRINYVDRRPDGGSIEAGIQSDYSIRTFDVTYSDYDWTTAQWTRDAARSNAYDLTNGIHAAFATYSDVLAEFQYQLGLRTEYMDRLLEQRTMGEEYSYSALDWFPSLSIARKFVDHQLQFSFSRRINRPHESLLNPFPFYSDRYLVSEGNPRILPEYTNAIELNYQKQFPVVYVSVQTYGRFSTNSLWQAMSADSTGRMHSRFGNFAETANMGAEISASLKPFEWLRLDPNVNLFQYSIEGEAIDERLDQSAFTWTARLSAICTFGPSTRVQVTGMYLSRQIGPQSETDPLFYLSLSARQEFFDRRISLTLQAQNLLRTAYYDIVSTGPTFSNAFVIKPEVPIVNLALSYNFNNYQPVRRPTDGVDVNVGM